MSFMGLLYCYAVDVGSYQRHRQWAWVNTSCMYVPVASKIAPGCILHCSQALPLFSPLYIWVAAWQGPIIVLYASAHSFPLFNWRLGLYVCIKKNIQIKGERSSRQVWVPLPSFANRTTVNLIAVRFFLSACCCIFVEAIPYNTLRFMATLYTESVWFIEVSMVSESVEGWGLELFNALLPHIPCICV